MTTAIKLNKEVVERFRAYIKIQKKTETEALIESAEMYKQTEIRHVVHIPLKNVRLEIPYSLWSEMKLRSKQKGELLPDAWNCAMWLYCQKFDQRLSEVL